MPQVLPYTITDPVLTSSSVPETDHAAWVSGTTYAAGDRVIRTGTHRIYERLIPGAGTTPPESDSANWRTPRPPTAGHVRQRCGHAHHGHHQHQRDAQHPGEPSTTSC